MQGISGRPFSEGEDEFRGPERLRRIGRHGYVGLIAVLCVVLLGELVYMLSWTSALPTLFATPSFTMTNMNGKPLSFGSLTGKVRLVTFFYSRCPSVCPLTAFYMEQIEKSLEARGLFGTKVDFVSIAFDPGYDTPAVVRRFAAHYNPNSKGWYFLSGSPSVTRRVLRAFHFSVESMGNGLYAHPAETFLVDQAGNVRKIYDTDTLDQTEVLSNIHNLLASPA